MKILVTADDFGLSHGNNVAIDYCMRNGLASSAQIVVNSEFTKEAIDLARAGGYMDKIGLHINLVSDKALSHPITEIEEYYKGGFNGFSLWSYKKVFGNKYISELREEIEAQIQYFLTFFPTKGLSTHHDIMFARPVLKAIKPLIKRYGFKMARGLEPYLFDLSGDYSGLRSVRYYPFKYYYLFCFITKKHINNCFILHGGKLINHFIRDYYVMEAGRKMKNHWARMKKNGCYEVIIHPYFDGTDYYDKTNFKNYSKGEIGLLSDTFEKINNLDIDMVSYNEVIFNKF